MQLSGLLITHQLSDEAVEWFRVLCEVTDELVAFVDEERAAPDLDRKLRHLDARIFNTRAPAFFNADFGAMVAACRGEWLLKVDYDEELSLEWRDPRWREVLVQDEFTHFWVPRRWTLPSGNYIASEPWSPDWQIRLLRNRPAEMVFPTHLHETMRVNGTAGYLRTLTIHHHDLRMTSRAARERKAAAYERERPGKGLGFFYLHEHYELPELPLPTESSFAPGGEILRMEALSDDECAQLCIETDPPPESLRPGELVWLNARLLNNTERVICCGAPHPFNLAYHWIDAVSRECVVFDGERSAILPAVAPHRTATLRMFIIAPTTAGEYVLRITVVQEHVRWLDGDDAPTTRDFRVTVAS